VDVFEQFVREIVKPSGGDLYLSVRKKMPSQAPSTSPTA
jgi:hypothetical protein